MERNLRIRLKSEFSEQNKVEAFVEQICDQHNIYNNYFANILTAVTEAFQNAVMHGNKMDNNKTIYLDFEVQSDGFSFCISDEGLGFDPNLINDPTDINSDDANAGRGIYLIKTLSDHMEYKNGGRTACIKFLISSINKEISDHRINKLKSFINQGITKHTSL